MASYVRDVTALGFQHWRWEVRSIDWVEFGEARSEREAYEAADAALERRWKQLSAERF